MADETAARNRKRRLLLIGGGALATAAVAAIVALAVVSANDADDKPETLPSAASLPAEPDQPEPTFSDVSVPPPPNPLDYISDPKKDTAPLSASTLYPGRKAAGGTRTYAMAAASDSTDCAAAASPRLGPVLTGNGCRRVIRATFHQGGVAVTVGVAVFDSPAQAAKAKQNAAGNIQPLAGGGVPAFCQATACRLTLNSVGRYAYFTVAGYTSGQAVTTADTLARQAGKDVSDYTFTRIRTRGEQQAAAAAAAQTSQ
ncbi:hypothetical protein ACH429_22260 [Streptomyces pathocidini]|uniref:Uncharacterized protein n=1 Tax=Streptomyces pathocidini TaxID=1650571 RepID=A0ABW7UW39_9ACTN